ncbi:MAG: hypothetical protein ISS63_04970 [Desulfobacteraceae bacterium]|nr:hypothetical protein [Desulfobacteraceae bacterium]
MNKHLLTGVGLIVLAAIIIASCTPRESKLEPFIQAMDAANRATRVINKGPGYAVMSETDAAEMLLHYQQALAHAEKVDADFLEAKYPGWGRHFDSEFKKGLRLILKAYESGDARTSIRGQKLLAAWGEWYGTNVRRIRKLR